MSKDYLNKNEAFTFLFHLYLHNSIKLLLSLFKTCLTAVRLLLQKTTLQEHGPAFT